MAKKVFRIISTVFLILLVLLVIFLFIIRLSGNSPSIFGYHLFRVSSDSMEPTLKVGDVILVGPASADSIHKGDIVTYVADQGEMTGQEITHRVVVEPEIKNGEYTYQTQGDADGAPLDPIITSDQIVGKFVVKLALIDKLYSFFFTPYGLIIFIVLIVVLFGYEMISLLVSYKTIDNISLEDSASKGSESGNDAEQDNNDESGDIDDSDNNEEPK